MRHKEVVSYSSGWAAPNLSGALREVLRIMGRRSGGEKRLSALSYQCICPNVHWNTKLLLVRIRFPIFKRNVLIFGEDMSLSCVPSHAWMGD